jgi:hypothetical protein
MRQLADAGSLDVALGRMFLLTLGTGANSDYLEVARERPAEFGSIIPFLEAAERYLGGGNFDWQRDVIDSHRSTPAKLQQHGTEPNPEPLMPEQKGEMRPPSNEANESAPSNQVTPSIAPGPVELPPATHAEQTALTPAAIKSDIRRKAQNAGRTAWDSALGEMVRMAQAAIGREPAPDILLQLVAAIKAARSGQKAWESSKPVLVDTNQFAVFQNALTVREVR